MSSTPFNTPEPDRTRAQDIIGKAVKISGQISSREDLYVDGDVEGTIELPAHRLTIGPNGKVRCNLMAREIVVLGNVQGKVDAADRLEVRKDGSLAGEIKTSRIVIEDGAYFKGNIDIVKHESAKLAAGVQPKTQVTPIAAAAPIN
ncbi:MAG TPA: polymer-forming cytoskeletal protein [Terriglobales bacterium]|nr:polymer-forming cytoskeletal protein [Terriglobales bacterium]